MVTILSSICGLASMLLMICSYVYGKKVGENNKKAYFQFQSCANFLFGLQYLFLAAYSACFSSLFGVAKNTIFMREEKKTGKVSLRWLIIFEIIYLVIGIFTYNGLISIIPIFISILYTWASWQPNFKIVCVVGITVGLLWVIYNLIVGAYVAIISGAIESISGVIGLVKIIRSDRKVASE